MVKVKELRSGKNQREGSVEFNYKPRSTREGSLEKSKFYTKLNVENIKSTIPNYNEDAITDERELMTEEESTSSDEADSVERRLEYGCESVNYVEKDGAKLTAEHNLEENDFVNRTNDPFALSITGSKLTNTFNGSGKYLVPALIAILLSIFIVIVHSGNTINVNNNNEKNTYEWRVKNFFNTIENIKNDFPSQENILWKSLFHKIKYVNESRPTRPAVMILIYNNSKEVAECIAWKIGKAASNFLNTPDMIELIGDSDMNETDNELVVQYREPLKKNGVMIVYRLDEIPGLVAQSFHTFCDIHSPLVERAVLLFTLDNSRLRNAGNIKPTKKAMEVLKLLWRDTLVDSKLNSLITRLTDSVLEVHSEKNIKCLK